MGAIEAALTGGFCYSKPMKVFRFILLLAIMGFMVWWLVLSDKTTNDVEISKGSIFPPEKSMSSRTVFVYDGISVPDDIRNLDLSGKSLKGSLKAEVRYLTRLKILNISDNNFTGVPAEVGQLSELEVLNLANNPVTGLPHEISKLKNLKILDLRGTQYSEYDLNIIQESLPDLEVLQ
tara:strand:+ start:3871 stop:4404 length:534 start_codon:yes stop_codon:yes gene_type:complete